MVLYVRRRMVWYGFGVLENLLAPRVSHGGCELQVLAVGDP